MISPASILHAHYGHPAVRGDNVAELVDHVGQCWHCGAAMSRGALVGDRA
jgi:hypothetical protein